MAYPVKQFEQFLRDMIGMPYWYGTCVHRCTTDLLNQKAKQYPKPHYVSGRLPRYKADVKAKYVASDCVGLIKGFFWTDGGKNVKAYIDGKVTSFTNKYASNGVPDVNADGMLTYLKNKGCKHGKIADIPEKLVAVFKPGHVGIYVGKGKVIEEQGFDYGCRENNLKDRKFVEWAEFPASWIDYGADTQPVKPVDPVRTKLGDRVLKLKSPMMRGDDVIELQTKLSQLGYACGEIDGVFGQKTENALKAFEKARGAKVDGILDAETAFLLDMAHTMPVEFREHVVKAGDTLWSIAVKYYNRGSDYTKIKSANNLKTDVLRVGQKLIIP